MSKKPFLNESTVRQFMKYANLGGLTDNFINETYIQEEDEVEEGRHDANEGMREEDEDGMREGEGMREEEMEEGAHDPDAELSELAPMVAAAAPVVAKGLATGAAGAVGGKMMKKAMGEGEHEVEEGAHEMEEAAHEMEEAHEGGEDAPEDEDADPVGGDDAELTDRLEQAAKKAAQALLDALGVEGEVSVDGAADDDMGDLGDMGDADDMPTMDDDDAEVLDEIGILDEEEIVNETMSRVMKRLSAMNESKKAEDKKNEIIESVADSIIARLRAKK